MVLVGVAVLGVTGLALGLWLAASDRWLAVAVDPRVAAVRAALPGTNCGACGFPGCDGAAAAAAAGDAPPTVCVAGGQGTADEVARILGVAAGSVRKMVAKVFCQGGTGRGLLKYRYRGVETCRAALMVAGGPKACGYACVGYGDCVRVCPQAAIAMGADRIPAVAPALCTGCGLCVAECPRQVIRLVPDERRVHILCSSHDRGPVVKKVCSVGCIGCTLCVKNCPDKAVAMDRFLAVMNYDACKHAGVCVGKCPTGTIVVEVRPGETPVVAPKAPAAGAAPTPAA